VYFKQNDEKMSLTFTPILNKETEIKINTRALPVHVSSYPTKTNRAAKVIEEATNSLANIEELYEADSIVPGYHEVCIKS
jgi:hypothetical protein